MVEPQASLTDAVASPGASGPGAVTELDRRHDDHDHHDHDVVSAGRPSLAARPLLAAVRAYQALTSGRPSPCRYWPSCSAYAVEALEVHGAVRGLALATWRIARCNPFGGHGVDPVPEKKHKKASRRV